MTIFSFCDDYSEGAHPNILSALMETNLTQQGAYGKDAYSIEAVQRIKAHLGETFQGAIHFVTGGTQANLVSIANCLRPHEAVITANSGHIALREAGAIEATGHKLITVPSFDGKITPERIEEALAANAQFPHMAKPRLIYLSNATETGTVYTLAELRQISALARQRGLVLFVDGARLPAALASHKNDVRWPISRRWSTCSGSAAPRTAHCSAKPLSSAIHLLPKTSPFISNNAAPC